MAQLIFKRGSLANLNNLAIKDGQFIVTTDEGALYVDNGSTRVRLGDFIVVENVAALPESANRKAMYYCEAENVLARWNGTEWKQINKQPTTAELKVALGLDDQGTVTAAIAAAKKAGDDAQKAVDDLDAYVGTFTHDTAKTVVEYINAKTDGIATSGNLEALGSRVTAVEGDVATIKGDYLKSTDKTALEGQISAVQTAVDNAQAYAEDVAGDLSTHTGNGDIHITAEERVLWTGKTDLDTVKALGYATKEEAQGYANAKDEAIEAAQAKADQAYELAGTKATMEQVNTAIAGAGHAVKADVDTAIENLGKAYVAADEALETKLQGNIDKKVDQTAYDTKVGELVAEDERLAGLISGNADAIAAEKERAEGVEADLQGQINLIMNNPDTKDVIDSISEFTQYITEHGEIAEGFRTDIDQNKADIAAEVKRAGEAESALSGRIDTLEAIDHEAYIAADETNLQAAKDYADDAVEALGIADYVKKADADNAYAAAGHNHDDKYDAIGAAAQALADAQAYADQAEADALSAAKTYADGLNTAMDARVDALEAIDHEAYKAYADQAEADAVATAEGKIATAKAEAIADAEGKIATAKSELEGKITAAETAAKGHADTEVGKVQSALETHTNKGDIHVTSADKEKWNAAETNAKSYSDEKLAEALQWGEF